MTPDEELRTMRRLRQRGYVKKAYDLQKQRFEELRKEVETLEHQYKQLLQASVASSPVAVEDAVVRQASPRRDHTLLRRYLDITQLKNQLYNENQTLYAANAEYVKLTNRLQHLLDMDEPILPLPDESPLQFCPLRDDEYFQVICETRDYVDRFLHSSGKISSGTRLFGWTDQRQIINDQLNFAVEKVFDGVTALELLDRTWPLLASPELYVKFYSATMGAKLRVLQRINADTILYTSTLAYGDGNVHLKSVYLVARLQYERGFMLVFRSIDKDRVAFRDHEMDHEQHNPPSVVFGEQCLWTIFQDQGTPSSPSCWYHFGGMVPSLFIVEVLLIALRWESLVVGPHLVLTP